MSSSGLIYAVIVGAWAAYLVPMWLRRQDELNEARPTERFSTAIRLLSGRAGMERRYAKELRARDADDEDRRAPDVDPDAKTELIDSVDVRAFAAPPDHTEARLELPGEAHSRSPGGGPSEAARGAGPSEAQGGATSPGPRRRPATRLAASRTAAERARRSRVLARRRRTTVILFFAFTLGAIAAAVGGLTFLWAPGIPAVLLSAYIVYLRRQERRRFVYVMDRRRAEAAAQRLRENRSRPPRRGRPPAPHQDDEAPAHPEPTPAVSPAEAGRRAVVEQTDHAEWVDQQRDRGPARGDSWDPVPVPLPTYVTAPVAPRATGGVDVTDPETWSAARSSPAEPTPPPPTRKNPNPSATAPRRPRDHGRTPLFDQYADEDRPRAANE
ncbi:gephyrin-like molybdotransferase receptor GlpR [Streptomyces sp. TRM49041]|uniref:divisome protein SepX/GlpR n=1 Tax=Streptomyces sp. TRM49041 TaxID=2603216 RepID=UPI0011ED69F2|nr:gephyrin-like molybdotransferase receptor GlpR [Streptomyces sp. TRM49041]